MDDYTPTTEDIRQVYQIQSHWEEFKSHSVSGEEFDRRLSAVKESAYWEGFGDGQDSERAY